MGLMIAQTISTIIVVVLTFALVAFIAMAIEADKASRPPRQ